MSLPWDHGITWFSRRIVEPTSLPLDVGYVRDFVLRVATDTQEDEHILQLIAAATDACEHDTERALMTQTWEMVLSGFPSGWIVLPRPPLQDVLSIDYFDSGEVASSIVSSPDDYLVSQSGKDVKARIAMPAGQVWPIASVRPDAVTITFRAGYASADAVPAMIKQGLCVHIAEQYKQRSLGVINVQYSPAALQLMHFWKKVY